MNNYDHMNDRTPTRLVAQALWALVTVAVDIGAVEEVDGIVKKYRSLKDDSMWAGAPIMEDLAETYELRTAVDTMQMMDAEFSSEGGYED